MDLVDRARALYRTRYGHEGPAFDHCHRQLQNLDIGGGRVLDAGCGGSEALRQLLGPRPRIVGADVERPQRQQSNLDSAEGDARLVQTRLEELPFAAGSFDAVASFMVIEHLEYPRRCFAELWRVLRPGGRCLLFTTNVLNPIMTASWLLPLNAKRALIKRFLPYRGEVAVHPTFYRANRPGKLRHLLATAGFRQIAISLHPGSAYYMTMNGLSLRLGWWWERWTDWAPLQSFKLYLVATAERPSM